eukprot:c19923_g1_i1.p1 GENE.c19923_g1_i1~~c19923_g1_i1.p1  ORF type:complete len:534 (+),score=199.65 c19923_g1_i1:2-1603(+)
MGQSLSSSVDAIVIERLGSENFSVGVSSMQGWRSNHEDSHSYDLKWRGDNIGHFAVFDGHGGEATAKYAAENLRNHQKTLTQPFKDSELRKNFLSLDEKLRKDLPQNTSGCTCVSAIITKESDNNYTLKVSNIGDSRVVLIRLEKEDLEATEDHKPENKIERERIEAAGGFVSDAQPPRVDGCLALSRAFGDFNYKQTSGIPANSQKVIAEPDIYTWKAKKGDIVVLACDGIFDVFTNEHLRDIIQSKFRAALKGKSGLSEVDVGEITSQIVTESLETGSQDNMTLMIICLEDGTKWNLPAELKPGNYNKEAAEPVLKCYQEFMTTAGFVLTHNKRSQNPLPLSCDECDRIFAEMKTCPCHTVNYCTQQCQKTHWKKHKDSCTHSNDSKKSKKGTTTTTTTDLNGSQVSSSQGTSPPTNSSQPTLKSAISTPTKQPLRKSKTREVRSATTSFIEKNEINEKEKVENIITKVPPKENNSTLYYQVAVIILVILFIFLSVVILLELRAIRVLLEAQPDASCGISGKNLGQTCTGK